MKDTDLLLLGAGAFLLLRNTSHTTESSGSSLADFPAFFTGQIGNPVYDNGTWSGSNVLQALPVIGPALDVASVLQNFSAEIQQPAGQAQFSSYISGVVAATPVFGPVVSLAPFVAQAQQELSTPAGQSQLVSYISSALNAIPVIGPALQLGSLFSSWF